MSNKTEDLISAYQTERIEGVYSKLLDRVVDVELLLPPAYSTSGKKYPLLILNDGQDNEAVKIKATTEDLTHQGLIQEIIVAGVVAGDRMNEYGVAARRDYLKRGNKAKSYSKYIVDELLPYLTYQYPVAPLADQHAIAGYSMGGLSAMDIAWNNPDVFHKAGIFSGSLWWRKRDSNSRFYSDHRDRILHQQIHKGKFKPGLKFWFQTGTQDEWGDRNKNGIIDSIDDTLDVIVELTKKGYKPFRDIQYLEMKDGKHNPETWALAMPHFLKWAFGN